MVKKKPKVHANPIGGEIGEDNDYYNVPIKVLPQKSSKRAVAYFNTKTIGELGCKMSNRFSVLNGEEESKLNRELSDISSSKDLMEHE